MRQLPLLAVIAALVFPAEALAQAAAGGQLMKGLQGEAAKDPATLPRSEAAGEQASQGFDGLGFTIKTLAPSRIVDINGSAFDGAVKEERPLQKPAAEDEEPPAGEVPAPGDEDSGRNDRDHKYHFEGKVTGIPSLTIYTAKKDKPGEDSTAKPSGGGWRKWLPKVLLFGGLAATIAGFFFPPALFLGGLLLGGYGMWKMMGGDG